MNILARVYFFGGLVAFTILAILLSIANPADVSHLDIAKWALVGAMASCVPILVAIEGFLINVRWLRPLLSDSSGKRYHGWIRLGALLLESFVIAIFCIVGASLIISIFYGDNAFKLLIADNATLFIAIIFAVSVVLSFLAGLLGRSK
ncbi:MAG TPA: hypothetical protein VEI74_12770 [Candidatus Methylomirabilis sp.]|nr:hypothetical protein [Candidatus Methylomirabilis sp.]